MGDVIETVADAEGLHAHAELGPGAAGVPGSCVTPAEGR